MRKLNLMDEKGISLVEVLASLVLITVLFSLTGSYFINSAKQTKLISNNYSAIQIADSLLDNYKSRDFSELSNLVAINTNVVVPIDIKDVLKIDTDAEVNSFSAKAKITKYNDRMIKIKITVTTKGIGKETSLEGYKRNEETK